jgi:transposase
VVQHLPGRAEVPGKISTEAGYQVILVIPSYTSKASSSCMGLFENLSLADRWLECSCGLPIDRNVNAALNILWVGQAFSGKSTNKGFKLPQETPLL